MKWEEKPLGEIITLRRGFDLPSHQRIYGAVPIISSSGITDYHNKAIRTGEGVVTGRYGTLGEVFYVNGDYHPLNTTLFVDDFKGNFPRFIFYLLKTLNLAQYNGAAAVPGLDRNVLHLIKTSIPPIPTQQKIAAILSAYDDLIENNLKRIRLLEEAAQHLYREWFVRFRFPGWEGVKMVDGLPEGWERKKLGEVTATIIRGISPKYVESDGFIVINQKCIRNQTLSYDEARLTSNATAVSAERILKRYDILVNSTGLGTLGRVAQVLETEFKQTVDSHVTIVRADENVISSIFLGFEMKRQQPFISGLGKGSTNQTELSRSELRDLVILNLPPMKLQMQFEGIAKTILSQLFNLQKQNQKLKSARDILLPRLMNQTIEV